MSTVAPGYLAAPRMAMPSTGSAPSVPVQTSGGAVMNTAWAPVAVTEPKNASRSAAYLAAHAGEPST
jgi:hypothetical protein